MDLTAIYRTLHSNIKECISFSSPSGTYFKIEHILRQVPPLRSRLHAQHEGKQEVNSIVSLELPCLIMSCQNFTFLFCKILSYYLIYLFLL